MNADQARLIDRELTERVIGAFFDTYNELGAGFLESVYEAALSVALEESGIAFERQAPLPVYFRGRLVGDYRADLLVERRLVVEIKAADTLIKAHEAQLLNYLKATRLPIGLLLNFGRHPHFKRMIFTPDQIRVHPRQSVAKDHV